MKFFIEMNGTRSRSDATSGLFLLEKTERPYNEIMKKLNGTIRVSCIDFDYFLTVEDPAGKKICEGSQYDSEIREAFRGLSNQDIASVEWFISKANETYVFDVNVGKVKPGDNWALNFLMEGGWVQDWGDCHSLGANAKIKNLKELG